MSFSRLENPPGFWRVSNDNIWMGVLVCPISRKHFLRVVSEWISDFGTISLGFLTLSPNSHLKWNCHYSFEGLACAGPRGKTLSMRNWALIHFGIFSHKMQNISIKTWECWREVACYTMTIPHFLSTDICTPSVAAPWEFLAFLFRKRNTKNGGDFFY